MALIVIAGRKKCAKFAFAEFVAGVLEHKLPHFTFRRKIIDDEVWDRWLLSKCQTHEWNYKTCPLVWRELAMTGGKEILIGGLSEFLEYCYEYYGLKAFLTDEERKILLEDINKFDEKAEEKSREYGTKNILISGANSHILPVLLSQLLKLPRLGTAPGLVISLYDNSSKKYHLQEAEKDSKLMGANAGLDACKVVHKLEYGLADCDVFIILDDFARKDDEVNKMYEHNYIAMLGLAKIIDDIASPNMRVIFAGPDNSPVCFNATVLCHETTILPPEHIVVVSAHIGLESMPVITNLTRTKVYDFASPAVWGFIGLNQHVDFDNMLYKARYFVPNKRALKRIPNSTLSQGKLFTELRRFIYMMESIKHVLGHIQQFKQCIQESNKEPNVLPKVKAIVALLTLWYSTDYDGEVISLGIVSDGTFGIPKGIVFSQPAVLINGMWKPYATYPMPEEQKCKLADLADASMKALRENAKKTITSIWMYANEKKDLMKEEEVAEKVEPIPTYEFPNPFEILRDLRSKNEAALHRFIKREKLEQEAPDDAKDWSTVISPLEDRLVYRSSTPTFRLSFHSIESLQRREAEEEAKTIVQGMFGTLDAVGKSEESKKEGKKEKNGGKEENEKNEKSETKEKTEESEETDETEEEKPQRGSKVGK